jgi:hypothetical protein
MSVSSEVDLNTTNENGMNVGEEAIGKFYDHYKKLDKVK